jgi:hypothetical protein
LSAAHFDTTTLLVCRLHPFEHLIVENALLGARSERQEFPEQEILVEPVRLVVTPLGLGLLAAMPGIGEDDGVAGLRLGGQILPGGEDALLARIRIDEAHHLLGAGAGERLGDIRGIVGGAVEIVALTDIVVDADHEAIKLGRGRRRGHGKKEQRGERGREAPATRPRHCSA